MKIRFAPCVALAAAIPAVLPAPASAQALLPPHEIITSVRSMGLQPVTPAKLRGLRYVVRAIDGNGEEVRVAADAVSGRVLFVQPMNRGPVYAERSYPPAYPDKFSPPPDRQDRRGSYERQGSYDRPPPLNPGEPSVIYAPRDKTDAPAPPARPPVASKPPAPKVAAKPAAKPAAVSVETQAVAPEQPSDATTGATAAAPPPEKNPALVAPPVQAFD